MRQARQRNDNTLACRLAHAPVAGHRWMLVADEHVQPLDPKLSPELARETDRYDHFEPAAWPTDQLRAECTKASFVPAL